MKDNEILKKFNSKSPLRFVELKNTQLNSEKIKLRIDTIEFPENVNRIKEIIHEAYLSYQRQKIIELKDKIEERKQLLNSFEDNQRYQYYLIEDVNASSIYD